ncbi:glucan biosynthesis protein, partial [Pseudomonas sp. RTB2]
HWTMDESSIHSPDLGWVKQTLRSTGDVKQSNLIRQPDGSVAFLVDFEGPVLAKLGEDPAIRSQVTTDDNTELVENNLRYNPVTKGWRLTLRLKAKDSGKSIDMRAYLLREVPAEPGKEPAAIVADKADKKVEKKVESKVAPKEEKTVIVKADTAKPAEAKGDSTKADVAKADSTKADAAKAEVAKADVAKDKDGKQIPQPEAETAPTNPEPAKNVQILTETWSYQLPADE